MLRWLSDQAQGRLQSPVDDNNIFRSTLGREAVSLITAKLNGSAIFWPELLPGPKAIHTIALHRR